MRTFLPWGFLLLFLLASCEEKSDKIQIGFFGALTGPDATFGLSSKDGIQLAMEEKNNSGGLLGKKIELKFYDTLGSTEEAKLTVERLISVDHVVAVLGEVASTRSLAGAPVAQKHGVPMITPSSTNPVITQTGNFIFRVCFIDPFQGEVMAKFAMHSKNLRKAAILRDKSSAYSNGLANDFIKTFTKLGGSIVEDQSYVGGDVDFLPQLQKIFKKQPEFMFVPGYYSEVGLIARQARNLGMTIPLMGGDGWDSASLTEISGDAINGSYFSNHYTLEDPRPEVQEFIRVFEARFGRKPDSQAASGYDAARILFAAIEKSKSVVPGEIRDALASTSGFKGVTGTISINDHRDAVKPAVVLQVQGRDFKFVESILP